MITVAIRKRARVCFFFRMARPFIDALAVYLKFDSNTSKWLLPLEPLLDISYGHRFCLIDREAHFLVYDDQYPGGEIWMTAREFYMRSKHIVDDLIERGYYSDDDTPTGSS